MVSKVFSLFFFKFNKFFPKIFITKEIGERIVKKTKLITIGETKLPSKIPNLNHNLFNGDKILEFNKPKTKNKKEMTIDQILIVSPLNNGSVEIIKKTIKKTSPKLLLLLTLILSFFKLLQS